MNAAAQRRLTPPLAILAVLLGLLLVALLAGLGRDVRWNPPRAAAAPAGDAHPAAPLPSPPPLAQFAEVWTHPLFNPLRRPMARAAGDGNFGELKLTGIILTPAVRVALLRGQNGADVRVREGDMLPDGGNRLVEVKPRSAVFEGDGGRVELQLPVGAPIDAPGHDAPAPLPGRAEANMQPRAPMAGPQVQRGTESDAPPGGAGKPGAPDARAERPHQGDEAAQAARVQILKDIIQKRRAAQAAGTKSEGDR